MESKRALRAWTLAVVLIALVITAATVSALSTGDRPQSRSPAIRLASPAERPAQGLSAHDTFTIALAADAWTLDPAATTDGVSWLVAGQIYDTLVHRQPGMAFCWRRTAGAGNCLA